jgi:hypothetical protein
MNKNFERRIERLEERVAPKPGPRHIFVTNVPGDDGEGGHGHTLELFPGLYVDVFGPALSEEEIKQLRERYRWDTWLEDK